MSWSEIGVSESHFGCLAVRYLVSRRDIFWLPRSEILGVSESMVGLLSVYDTRVYDTRVLLQDKRKR